MEKTLSEWSKWGLSLFGKVEVIIKEYAISKLVFVASLHEIDADIEARLESIFHKFLWGPKDRIKRSSLKNRVKNGGLK